MLVGTTYSQNYAEMTSPGNENELETLEYGRQQEILAEQGEKNPSFTKFVPIKTDNYK